MNQSLPVSLRNIRASLSQEPNGFASFNVAKYPKDFTYFWSK